MENGRKGGLIEACKIVTGEGSYIGTQDVWNEYGLWKTEPQGTGKSY